ncbi:DUF4123 domain-containing protein [Pseudomonas sp. NPDC089401]|uniref:DUF4123 domain-containing protein n=1 Tax=Pseudomonas sp. NPDC089401 TaxID=3364462 RepID=UPI0037FD8F2B
MNAMTPWAWMAQQRAAGRSIALMLDAGFDERAALLACLPGERWSALYAQTEVAHLTELGPCCFMVGEAEVKIVQTLLDAPQRHWGWLASLPAGGLPEWTAHWRARLLIGQRPRQVLYRCHDDRVLAATLHALPVNALPAFLGPAISVCYWQGTRWAQQDNPAPGMYPLPTEPLWLQARPDSEATAQEVLLANAHRFLLARHFAVYLKVFELPTGPDWLRKQLALAREWGWETPEQREFLLVQSLRMPGFELPGAWGPQVGESPQSHLERLRYRTVDQ